MSVIKLKGLVLNEIKKNEADKVLTLFTLEEGKTFVYCKGARKLKSRYFSGSSQFDYSDFVLYSGRDFYSATQIDKITAFPAISSDYEKFCYGNLFLELVDKTTFQGESNSEILKLLLASLKALEQSITDDFCICQGFLFKYLQICGYEPVVEICADCSSELDKNELYYGKSGVLCPLCAVKNPIAAKVNNAALYTINYILNSEIKAVFSYKLDTLSKEYLKQASDISLSNFDVILNCKKNLDEISI
ncbi:MAG: DNA repair protein RecO [Defluviitaleaceae bacterium]|nr:DNA repair protein RecO [Defluviitaleaceae bacterium]